jgi:isocitrate dehydrogenase
MKYTEGAFRGWAYDVATSEFGEKIVLESEMSRANTRQGRVMVRDRIADNMFQQVLLKPRSYDVIVTTNLNGDYLSDALAAQVGGLGMAPGANVGDHHAVFEATHGTAPKYSGADRMNPCSLILSGAMMLDYLGWIEAADAVRSAVGKTIRSGVMTCDLARLVKGSREVSTSGLAKEICSNL